MNNATAQPSYGLGATVSSAIKTCFHLVHAVEVTAETIDNSAIIANKYCDVYLKNQLAELEAELAQA